MQLYPAKNMLNGISFFKKFISCKRKLQLYRFHLNIAYS